MIKAIGLSKTYGRVPALTDVSIEVGRGDCIALTGANGSGRTTLLRILATLIRPTGGTLEIDGLDALTHVHQVRSRLAYVGAEPRTDMSRSALRVDEYLRFVQSARKPMTLSDAEAGIRTALARGGLNGGTPLNALSAGMRQRMSLAAALAFTPDVLLLDDPLRSLDSEGNASFLDWLSEARDGGATIIAAVSSDSDVAAICRRAAELDAGHMKALASTTTSRQDIVHEIPPVMATSPA